VALNIESFIVLWRNIPPQARAEIFLRSLGDTHAHSHTVGLPWTSDQPVAEATTYPAHNIQKSQTLLFSAGFEPSISAFKRP